MTDLSSLSDSELQARYAAMQGASKLSDEELVRAYVEAKGASADGRSADKKEPKQRSDALGGLSQFALDLLAGGARGAGSIGATLLAPIDMAKDAIDGKGLSLESNRARRADMTAATESLGADTDSWTYRSGKLATELAGTAGVGNVVAAPVRAISALSSRAGAGAIPALETVATTLASGGMRTGTQMSVAGNIAARGGAGVVTGGASAGLVNPDNAATGAAIGGVVPLAIRGGGAVFESMGRGMRELVGKASPEVRTLAERAYELGIKVPADRILNSDALNAMASSLRYIPLSGRSATERTMEAQMNRALSRTIGQNTSNMTHALNNARLKLGDQFDHFLKNNTVRIDEQFVDDLAEAATMANRELSSDGASIIGKQIDEIVAKASSGEINGQAAYAIKRTLDRIGRRNAPEAWYALDLKGRLMDALNRSVGDEAAAGFAALRSQYGAMLELEKLGVRNGVEGTVSAGKLAGMQDIRNPQIKELADVAQQFLRTRESAHGAAQRVGVGAAVTAASGVLGGPAGAVVGAGGMMAGGRAMNALLNSEPARRAALGATNPASLGVNAAAPSLTGGAARALPVTGAAAVSSGPAADDVPRALTEEQQPAPTPIAAPVLPQKTSAAAGSEMLASATNVDQAIAGAMLATSEPMPPAAAPAVQLAPAVVAEAPTAQPVSAIVPDQSGGLMEETVQAGVDAPNDQPVSIWTGRKGGGYAEVADAMTAMRTREKVSPELNWRVERMRDGKLRLAGYERSEEPGLMQEQPQQAPMAQMNPTGTATVTDPTGEARQMLASNGIRFIPMRDGSVLVGTSQAQQAMQLMGVA
jgi:hypothetical protein